MEKGQRDFELRTKSENSGNLDALKAIVFKKGTDRDYRSMKCIV